MIIFCLLVYRRMSEDSNTVLAPAVFIPSEGWCPVSSVWTVQLPDSYTKNKGIVHSLGKDEAYKNKNMRALKLL